MEGRKVENEVNMNKLVTGTGYPADRLPHAPICSASEFVQTIASQRLLHFETQNLSVLPPYSILNSRTACQLNMPMTHTWWLLLRGPDPWLDRSDIEEFLASYVPRMEQFLRALEQRETWGDVSVLENA